jgi:ribose transport system ATP-binding protein
MSGVPYAVQMRGITKSFGGVRALIDGHFELRRGEVHALMGENGAGKSTLMKVLVGVYTPDSGTIEVNGEPVEIRTVQAARERGIAMIFQEFSLVPTLTVAQNIFLTREPRGRLSLLDDRAAEKRTRAIFADMQVDVDPRATVRDLSTGLAQLTEIAKALSQDARVLIMDEPSAALASAETRSLFDLMERLKDQGIAIVYVSHRMEEIFQVADRVTVLRDGANVATEVIADVDMPKVIEYIVGRKVQIQHEERDVDRRPAPLLEVTGLSSGTKVHDVTFRVHPGEIVGLAGLMGSGRSELVGALFGINPISAGEVRIRGRPITVRSPRDAIDAGMALIPEDRRAQGLILDHSIKDNLLVPQLRSLRRAGLIDDQEGDQIVTSYVDRLRVRTDSIHKLIRLLSGGNQQKVVIAKWLATKPQLLLMDEPTAGVDIQTKADIVSIIRELAEQGNGIVVISSELPELLAVSDRIIVLRAGRVYQEVSRRELADFATATIVLSGATGNGKTQMAAEEEALNQIIQGVYGVNAIGPHGEQPTSASALTLTPDEVARVRAMKAKAAVVMHYGGHDWSRAQISGLRSEFGHLGVEIAEVTDAGFRPDTQVADIEAVLAKNVDVIVSIPTDPEATSHAYRAAAQRGVKVVFMDNVPAGLDHGKDYVGMVSADNYGNGLASAHLMAAAIGRKGTVGCVYHAADFFATNRRWQAFEETISNRYPKIEIVAREGVTGPDFVAEAERAAGSMLDSHPELAAIWAAWDVVAEGVLAAARARRRTDLVVTTIDLGRAVAMDLAEGGLVKGIGAQRPFDQGVAEATVAAYGLLGKPAPPFVALPSLPVTRDGVLDAWTVVYHEQPPPELTAATRSSPARKEGGSDGHGAD